jgi:cation diffusion facilitator family transporter
MPDIALTPEQQETRRRVRAVRIAIAASFSVGIIEVSLGWILGLESLVAEGIHTLLDGIDSIIVLIAVLVAARPADRSHQFGHGKFEALGASVEGSFVFIAGLGIAYRAIGRLMRGEAPEQIPMYICLAMGVAAVFYFGVSLYLMREARATKSPAILAEAIHLQTHIYITGGLGLGLLIGAIGDWPIADTILSLAVAVCLVWISGHIFREVIRQFTDAALPTNELDVLGRIIERFSDRFVEVHGVRTRQSGAERHLEMHLVVKPETTVASAHALGHEIEAAIAEKWPTTRIMVHIEPFNTADRNHEQWMAGQPKVRTRDASPDEREFIH